MGALADHCACGFKYYDTRNICWKCQKRPCSSCGKDTGSPFIELCIGCAKSDTSADMPYAPKCAAPPPVQSEPEPEPKPKAKPKPKPKGKRK